MSDAAKCGRVRGWMADAASGSLSDVRRGEFEEHIGDCAACRAEFARIENLLGRIDESLRAELAVEPSPKLVLGVRESIAAETQSTRLTIGWLTRTPWLSAAGVCAAVAALVILMLTHRTNRPDGHFAPHPQIATSAPAHLPVAPSRSASASRENFPPGAPAHVRVNKPRLAVARNASPRNPRVDSTEPEVIVQPGQIQALMQFVAASEKSQVNAAKVFDEIHRDSKPLVVEPLAITPLKMAALDGDSAQESPSVNAPESKP